MGILSGLKGLGLENLEGIDIFEKKETKQRKKKEAVQAPVPEEKDYIFDRMYKCPVCETEFPSKMMKTGKAKLIGTDLDLRPKYEGIDTLKYDVVLCPVCGYAALVRYFAALSSAQAKLIREKISQNVHINIYKDEIYSYEQAMERYQLALVCAVVKRAKDSEKAFVCLKTAWMLRGWKESLLSTGGSEEKVAELELKETEYLQNAYKGFREARMKEIFPICGMDENTLDYLLAVMAIRFEEYETAARLVSSILGSSSATARIKDKARDLKEDIVAGMKK